MKYQEQSGYAFLYKDDFNLKVKRKRGRIYANTVFRL